MRTAIVLFTRDLRVHDQPALAAAVAGADRVVPLFVFDARCSRASVRPTASRFLLDALGDLRRVAARARRRGSSCARGDVVGRDDARGRRGAVPSAIFVERGRERLCAGARAAPARSLRRGRLELHVLPGVTVIPPGDLAAGRRRPLPRLHALLAPLADAPRRPACAPAADRAARRRRGRTAPALAGLARGAPRRSCRGRRDRRRAARLDALAARAVSRGYERAARRSRRRRDLAAQPVPAPRLPVAARGGRARERRTAPSRSSASSAGATSTRSCSLRARDRARTTSARAAIAGATTPTALRGLEGGPHRLPDRRRRHAPARARGVHAQPRPAARASFLTKDLHLDWRARRGALRRAARRRRRGEQHRQLAVGRGHGRRHAAGARCFNPICAGEALRSRAATTSAATCPSSPASRAPRCTSRGSSARCRAAIPSRSSITPRRWRDCASARHTRAHDVRRPGAAAAAGQGSRRRALRRAARRGDARPRGPPVAGAFQPRVPARLRRVAPPVPADPPPRARRGAAALDGPLGRRHLHHGRAASIGSFTTSFRRAYGQSPTQYRAAYPPAASRARIPTCMQRAGRARSRAS